MKMEILAVAVAAVLLFGCFGGGNGEATPTPAQGGGATPLPGGNGGATPTPGGSGLAGLGWDALVGLGTSIECTMLSDGQAWQMKIRGEDFRSEATVVQDGKTMNMLMIGKNDAVYMMMEEEMKQAPGMEDCVWLMMEKQENGEAPPAGAANVDYASVPPENLRCMPAVFGDEVFATPGRICTMEEFMGGLMPTPGGDYGDMDACAYCSMITDPEERAACLEYC